MDRNTALEHALSEISRGKITEMNISSIKNYSNDKSRWLQTINSGDFLLICDAFEKFISTSEASSLNLQVMIIVLESYSHRNTSNSSFLMTHCLKSICQFLYTTLEKVKSKMKVREKSALLKILSLLTNLELDFESLPTKLLKLMFRVVFNEENDFDEYCLLFLLSVLKNDKASNFVTETVFEIVEEKMAKFRKTYAVLDKTVPMPFAFLMAYSQGLLGDGRKSAYEKAFRFTAHFVDNLCKKCTNNPKFKVFMIFADEYLTSLIKFSCDPTWPVAPLILQLITKNIFCKLLGKQECYRLQSFLIKLIPRIAERLKDCEIAKKGYDFPPKLLKKKITSYVEMLPKDYIKGDILQAYHNLWKRFYSISDETEEHISSSQKEAECAILVLDTYRQSPASAIECLKLLIQCSSSANKLVKTNAIKALGKVILLDPKFLSLNQVQFVLGECLESLIASGRVSVANMFGTFLSSDPSMTEKFIHYFLILLNDDAYTVRRAAINAVGLICAVDYFHRMELLATKILMLFYDPEIPVQEAVLEFFTTVFVKRVNHLGCLVEINVNASIRKLMIPILKKLVEGCKEEKHDLDVQLSLLVEAVILYLKTNSEEKKRLAAGVVLEALAEVYPSCLTNQVSDILRLFHCHQKEPYLKKKLCHVLIAFSNLMKDEEKNDIYKYVKKLIIKKFDWDKLGPCIIELLKILVTFAQENIFECLVQPSFEILLKVRDERFVRRDIFLPLSIVAFLWKDYEKCENVTNLLMDFLREPCYQMTVLTALTEARLETASEKVNPVLNGLINGFILDTNQPHLVVAGLKYLNNCLRGDEANYEKPEMKALGDSSTASLSQLLQETLQAVLACTLNPNLSIRCAACGVVCHIVQSGLILRSHFFPHLVAMTADDCVEIRNTALNALKDMPEADISLFAIHGVHHAYTLLKALHPGTIVRGAVKDNTNSVCHKTFELIRAPAKIRKLLENLITDATKIETMEKVIFMMDNVVFYPYKASNEVHYVCDTLAKVIFQFRKTFHARIFQMAKETLEKSYKISSCRQKMPTDKLQRATISEYLASQFYDIWKASDEDAAMVFLMATEDDTDSEGEPEKQLDDLLIDDSEIVFQKPRKRESKSQKRKGQGASPRSRKRSSVNSVPENPPAGPSRQVVLTENTLPEVYVTDEDLNCSDGYGNLFP